MIWIGILIGIIVGVLLTLGFSRLCYAYVEFRKKQLEDAQFLAIAKDFSTNE